MAAALAEVDLEAQAYVKVHFTVKDQDDTIWQHEADLNAYEQIGNLKTELAQQLGDPDLSEWIRTRTNKILRDDDILQEHDEDHDNILITVEPRQGPN